MKATKLVMLVDDQPDVKIQIESLLNKKGCEHACFDDAKEAMQFFTENHRAIDLVIIDLMMPDITGYSMAKEMWKMKAHLPVILLNKPITEDELLKAVSRYL